MSAGPLVLRWDSGTARHDRVWLEVGVRDEAMKHERRNIMARPNLGGNGLAQKHCGKGADGDVDQTMGSNAPKRRSGGGGDGR